MSELINNKDKRVEILAEIIKGLHKGEDRESVRRKLAELVRETSSEEIASMEQQLISEGMAIEEVKGMCDLHSQVLGEILHENMTARTTSGHPVQTFHRENEALRAVAKEMRALVAGLNKDNLSTRIPLWRELYLFLYQFVYPLRSLSSYNYNHHVPMHQ